MASKLASDQYLFNFPEGFLWGAATSHFQVEGHPVEIGTRLSDWAQWTAQDGKIADSTTADKACEFYSRYASDIELCEKLNLNAFRLSLNWAALIPNAPLSEGDNLQLDPAGVDYYRGILTALKANGITTFVTLFHFCLPYWLAEKGGWNEESTVRHFARFAELAADAFSDLVDYWITINEPLAYAYQGYIAGSWPPGLRNNYVAAFSCVRNMLEGHARAYHALHKRDPQAKVSFTMHWRPFKAKHWWHPLDHIVRYYRDYVFNHIFPEAIQNGVLRFPFPLNQRGLLKKISGPVANLKGTLDWIAVNYYTRELCQFNYKNPFDIFGTAAEEHELPTNGMGWVSYPDGLYQLLTCDMAPYRHAPDGTARQIIITENGFATDHPAELSEGDWSLSDDTRIQYMTSHLMAIHRAIRSGANVKGYLYWSLLDNFEWAEGLKLRFGLVRVSYPTQERTLRKSALVYAEFARQNAIDIKPSGMQVI